ncbi:MAG: OmpA family protein, partial [Bacteroidota bacterium]|nr:OmpA family protein [Bacteroidota bacterium]
LALFLSGMSVFSANAQADRSLWKEAEGSLMVHDYRNARINYNMLLDKDEDNANYAFKIGYCYLHDEEVNNVETAIKYLEEAEENISKNYNDNFSETKAPPETEYFLGVAYRLQADHLKALEHFKKYKSYDSYKLEGVNEELIDREISNCEFTLSNPPEEFQVKKYSFDIDVPEGQYLRCPVISGNDSVFVYTLGDQNIYPPDININRDLYYLPVDDIYFSTWGNDGWTEPENISEDLGVSGFAMPTYISYDGKKLLLVQDDGDDGNIYMSEFKNGQWQKIKKLNKNINTNKWETHAIMNKDETKMYFASARKSGFGDLDIYVSSREVNESEWKEPTILSDVINTEMHEETPFLLEQENQLYFGSEKHGNMGGFDMFVSVYDSTKSRWDYPINLGYPFNTVGNDLAYIVSFKDLFIYCPQNSNRRRDGLSGSDCFSLIMPPREKLFTLKGKIYIPQLDNQIPMDLKIAAIDNATNDTISIHEPAPDGSFVIKDLPAEDITLVAMSSEKVQNQIIEVNIPDSYDRIEYPIDFYLKPSELALAEMEEDTLALNQEAEDTSQVEEEETEELALQEEIAVEDVQVEKDTSQVEEETEELALHEEVEIKEVQADTIEKEPVTAQTELVIEPVFFDFDKSNIKPQYKDNLNKLADFMKEEPGFEIEIHGHTDHIGPETYNVGLGNRRANAIRKYLTQNGVNKDNIITKSFGESKPVAKQLAINAARKFNRRAEFRLTGDYENINLASVYVPDRYRLLGSGQYDMASGTGSGASLADGSLHGKYLIIGGSFMYPDNAKNAATMYDDMGYNSHILHADNGFDRVAIKAFETKEEALQQLPALRQATSVNELWILSQ